MSARKAKTETTVVAYKGTDKDMACRGFAFELGRTYEHDGKVVACQSGFHACENPFDVWSYYGPADGNRFFRVTLGGELSRHGDDSKIAAGRITLDAELRLPDLVNDAVKWVIAATKGKKDASGNYAQIGSSGDSAKIGSSGYSAQIGSSGDSAQIGSSGNYAQIGSSGNYAQIDATGKAAIIACAGQGSVARADEDGAICLAWNDGKRTRFAVGYVGEDGIEAGVWYRAEAGKLVRAK